MATLFHDLVTISRDSGFQGRVAYALTVAAVNVAAENPDTAGHPARVAFARLVFAGGYNIITICLMVLTNSTIAAEAVVATTPDFAIPDGDIQFAVNSIWNDLSGV